MGSRLGLWQDVLVAILKVPLEMDRQPWVASVVSVKGFPYQRQSEYVCPFVRSDIPLYATFFLLKKYKLGNPVDCRNILYNLQLSAKIH